MPDHIGELPSRVDLYPIPRWSLVAFTLRCAERVFPLIERANVSHAESAAELIRAANKGALTGDSINASTFKVDCPTPAEADKAYRGAFFVVNRLNITVKAAMAILRMSEDDDPLDFITRSAEAASSASFAAWNAVRAAKQAKHFVPQAILRDFAVIRTHERSNAAFGLDPKSLGPLWPYGTPDWYYESDLLLYGPSSAFDSLPMLELYFEPGNAPKKSLQRVMEALSKFHIAAGGGGLTFQPGDGFVFAKEQVPA